MALSHQSQACEAGLVVGVSEVSWIKTPKGRKATAVALTVAAVGMLSAAVWFGAYPLYTNIKASKAQDGLRQAFAAPSFKLSYGSGKVEEGSPLTRIVIPSIGVDSMVVEGISLKALNTGAGHYPMTPMPGQPGNIGIAGHRTMYGKPFNRLDELKPGDKVTLLTPFAKYRYEVVPAFEGHANPWVVNKNSWDVVKPSRESILTLTACHPKGSSSKRIVARAKLVEEEPIT